MRLLSNIINGIVNKFVKRQPKLKQNYIVEEPVDIIRDSMVEKCIDTAVEGTILLKNDNDCLPLKENDNVAIFGRCAYDYFVVGYGSGGDVKRPYVSSLIDGIKKYNIPYNTELDDVYLKWVNNNKPDNGFWGHWPFNYPEYDIEEAEVIKASKTSNKAIIVIGRAAGEDRECLLKEGSYYLTTKEERLMKLVLKYFKDTILILDIGNIMDLSFTLKYNFSSILLPFQAGQESGKALALVISGKRNPSGHLSDTIAINYEDYPSSKDFGAKEYNNYTEDFFVGYRYFETFKKDRVLYPFGYGLTYTKFEIKLENVKVCDYEYVFTFKVKNIKDRSGKCSIQIYLSKPQDHFSEPSVILVGFAKTNELSINAEELVNIHIDLKDFATYDDAGILEDASYVLSDGEYVFYVGENSRELEEIYRMKYNYHEVIKKVSHIMPLKKEDVFKRMINKNGEIAYEDVPTYDIDLKNIILNNLPKEIPLKKYKGHKLVDVKNGVITLDEFISELTLDEMNTLCHGAGAMNSPLGVKENAGAMGGLTESLREKGIPPYIVSDGPSGMRVAYRSTQLPSGTTIASTWNLPLVEELFEEERLEMKDRKIDCILAPGLNIHRNPLCGRNFEYFSEDPLLSGLMGASVCRGIGKKGYSATPKHFFGNNQEYNRHQNDSRISERAIREIYLKNFEYCLKNSNPLNIMTSYNKVNSIYSHNNYYLTQIYLREELGFKYNVMTDWWMQYVTSPDFKLVHGNAYRVRSRCDVLMPGSESYLKPGIGNTLLENYLKKDAITLAEIELCVKDLLTMILASNHFEN